MRMLYKFFSLYTNIAMAAFAELQMSSVSRVAVTLLEGTAATTIPPKVAFNLLVCSIFTVVL